MQRIWVHSHNGDESKSKTCHDKLLAQRGSSGASVVVHYEAPLFCQVLPSLESTTRREFPMLREPASAELLASSGIARTRRTRGIDQLGLCSRFSHISSSPNSLIERYFTCSGVLDSTSQGFRAWQISGGRIFGPRFPSF